jgi:predicted transcriptional regulator
LDGVEHSQNRATNTVTEINFGLRSAGSGRLARHDRPGRRSIYLRTAVNFGLHSAERGRLARHGRYEPWSTYLRTAINVLCFAAHAPSQRHSAPAVSRLSALTYRLSPISYRLSPIAYTAHAPSQRRSAPAEAVADPPRGRSSPQMRRSRGTADAVGQGVTETLDGTACRHTTDGRAVR